MTSLRNVEGRQLDVMMQDHDVRRWPLLELATYLPEDARALFDRTRERFDYPRRRALGSLKKAARHVEWLGVVSKPVLAALVLFLFGCAKSDAYEGATGAPPVASSTSAIAAPASAIAASSSSSESATAVPGDIAAQASAVFDELATTVTSNDGDCDTLAVALAAFVAKNEATLKRIGERKKTGTPEEKKGLDELKTRFRPILKTKIVPVVQHCQKNAAVVAAWKKIDG